MVELIITNDLKGDLGETIFEHYSIQNNFAYTKTEEIYRELTLENILTFRFDRERIKVKIPGLVEDELRKFARPSGYIGNDPSKPAFVFDYLTIRRNYAIKQDPAPARFQWAEIKTGESKLTSNQEKAKNETKLDLYVIRFNLPPLEGIKVIDLERYRNGKKI
jgi:hypothetical protein